MAEIVSGLRAYGLVVRMWTRSALAYRLSFVMMTFGNAALTLLDFAAVAIIFGHTTRLGGFSLAQTAFLYGTSGMALGLADLVLGSMDGLGRRVRDGTLDVMLVRSAPVFAQVAADRFALRRLGRVSQAALVLAWSLTRLDVAWTPGKVLLLPVALVSGAVIFSAVYTLGASFQFRFGDASELQNSFTYGGNALTQYPPAVFGKDLVRGATFVVPLAFVNWLPASLILGTPQPLGLPHWVDCASPLVALALCAVAGVAWRAGVRSYRSTGS